MTVGWVEVLAEDRMDHLAVSEYSVLRRLIEREGRLPAVWWYQPPHGARGERPEAVLIGVDPLRPAPHFTVDYDYGVRPGWQTAFCAPSAFLRWARRRFPERLALSCHSSPRVFLSGMIDEAFDPRLPYRERHPDLWAEVQTIETLRSLT